MERLKFTLWTGIGSMSINKRFFLLKTDRYGKGSQSVCICVTVYKYVHIYACVYVDLIPNSFIDRVLGAMTPL